MFYIIIAAKVKKPNFEIKVKKLLKDQCHETKLYKNHENRVNSTKCVVCEFFSIRDAFTASLLFC